MDGWSVPRNGSVLDCGETGGSCETDGICVDIGNNNSLNGTDKLQVLFDQVLLIFMKEVLGNECVRPIPAMLGDGRSVDLFKLFWVVRGKGGYEWVSDKGLWGLVAEECGLDVGVKTCLKLIYFKYLDQLDQWLLGILRDGSLDKGEGECGGKLDSVLEELGTEFRGLILGGTGPKEKDDGVFELESERTDNCVDLDKEKSILNLSIVLRRAEKSPNDDDEKNCVDGGDDVAIQDPIIAKKSSFSRKRKRESFSGMLNWVREIAKHPEEPYKGNKNGNEVFSTQILRVRESLLIRRKVHTKEEQSLLQALYGGDIYVYGHLKAHIHCL
uniref:ARID domain-containing protein n=1 Tax=Vitis vinifera TaxID=29760 RepID=F6HUL4_VITVI